MPSYYVIDTTLSSRFPIYTRANVGEVFPDPVTPADGVIVDVGAPLSHAIIVSRELGIPCVISATNATRRIPDGAWVRIDGGTGLVEVL